MADTDYNRNHFRRFVLSAFKSGGNETVTLEALRVFNPELKHIEFWFERFRKQLFTFDDVQYSPETDVGYAKPPPTTTMVKNLFEQFKRSVDNVATQTNQRGKRLSGQFDNDDIMEVHVKPECIEFNFSAFNTAKKLKYSPDPSNPNGCSISCEDRQESVSVSNTKHPNQAVVDILEFLYYKKSLKLLKMHGEGDEANTFFPYLMICLEANEVKIEKVEINSMDGNCFDWMTYSVSLDPNNIEITTKGLAMDQAECMKEKVLDDKNRIKKFRVRTMDQKLNRDEIVKKLGLVRYGGTSELYKRDNLEAGIDANMLYLGLQR